MAGTIGQANPIRYRGYYYDTETGFYYLKSRYYDPITGRFLNADSQLNLKDGILGFNMFAYCGSNPVNRYDPNGEEFLTFTIFGVAVWKIGAALISLFALSYIATDAIAKNPPVIPSISIPKFETKSKTKSKSREKEKTTTAPPKNEISYWVADLVDKHVVVSQPLTAREASFRVATGRNIMCRNKAAAQYIILINGYANAVGPEKGCGESFYWHYHPTRNHTGYDSIHIWYYE